MKTVSQAQLHISILEFGLKWRLYHVGNWPPSTGSVLSEFGLSASGRSKPLLEIIALLRSLFEFHKLSGEIHNIERIILDDPFETFSYDVLRQVVEHFPRRYGNSRQPHVALLVVRISQVWQQSWVVL